MDPEIYFMMGLIDFKFILRKFENEVIKNNGKDKGVEVVDDQIEE